MENQSGYIYILTNPSFPEYVKIGYADNVDERIAQLNRSECTPFAFRKYAVLHVTSRLADKNVHKLIDKFKPELRAKENINGKMRVREFFSMSAKEAVELLSTIGSIYGESPQIYEPTTEEKQEEKLAEEAATDSERKSPFSFYKCGIKNGDTITYALNPNITCTVVGNREIVYEGKKTSLSALAKKLLNCKNGVQGPLYFKFNGEVLSALRKRLEDKGEYREQQKDEPAPSKETLTTKNEIFLYFTMQQFPATCKWSNNKFLLLKGSKISLTYTQSCPSWIKNLHKENAPFIDKNGFLLTDLLFNSCSAAAGFVAGSSINGKLYWKTKDGTLLSDIIK